MRDLALRRAAGLTGLERLVFDFADVADTVPIFAQAAQAKLTYFAQEAPSPSAQAIVVRIQPEGAAVFPDCDVQAQYRTMQLLQGSGLPVPPLLGLEMDPAVLGAPFFIMGRLPGPVPNEKPQ